MRHVSGLVWQVYLIRHSRISAAWLGPLTGPATHPPTRVRTGLSCAQSSECQHETTLRHQTLGASSWRGGTVTGWWWSVITWPTPTWWAQSVRPQWTWASPGPGQWRTGLSGLTPGTGGIDTTLWSLCSNNPCLGEVPSPSDPSWWEETAPSPSDFSNQNPPPIHSRTLVQAPRVTLVSLIKARRSFGTNTRETSLAPPSSLASGQGRPRPRLW